MLTAAVVIETLPGWAGEVEHQLAVRPELRIRKTSTMRLAGVCTVPQSETLDEYLDRLVAEEPAIVSIRPTFVSD